MPELPEVQCFADALNEKYAGKKVNKILLRRPDLRFPFETKKLSEIFSPGVVLKRFSRTGKLLVVETSHGKVHVSLGMSGKFVPSNPNKPQLHEHVTLLFSDKEALGFVDPRRFGFWKTGDVPQDGIANPLKETELGKLFSSEDVRKSKRVVKDFLMDQKRIGGIGNIYALEALFLAKVHPLTTCEKISNAQWKKLAQVIPPLLNLAIERGGSSIATYRNFSGNVGGMQDLHKVYGRDGEKCVSKGCKGIIQRVAQGGRGIWFCPLCQSPIR